MRAAATLPEQRRRSTSTRRASSTRATPPRSQARASSTRVTRSPSAHGQGVFDQGHAEREHRHGQGVYEQGHSDKDDPEQDVPDDSDRTSS